MKTIKRSDAIAFRRALQTQAKLAARELGVVVILDPAETESIAITSNLPPISDGQAWRAGLNLCAGTIVERGGKNYQVIQGHISQADWPPESVPALFMAIKDDCAEWVQPQGAHDAYMAGDRVKYLGKIYESLINANVYSPAAYPAGWREIAQAEANRRV